MSGKTARLKTCFVAVLCCLCCPGRARIISRSTRRTSSATIGTKPTGAISRASVERWPADRSCLPHYVTTRPGVRPDEPGQAQPEQQAELQIRGHTPP